MENPNCYKCKFRGSVPGDAHSCCRHPVTKQLNDNPLIALLAILGKNHQCEMHDVWKKLNIRGNEHGIKSGWFCWPFNFDPVWLEHCDGFEKKDG